MTKSKYADGVFTRREENLMDALCDVLLHLASATSQLKKIHLQARDLRAAAGKTNPSHLLKELPRMVRICQQLGSVEDEVIVEGHERIYKSAGEVYASFRAYEAMFIYNKAPAFLVDGKPCKFEDLPPDSKWRKLLTTEGTKS